MEGSGDQVSLALSHGRVCIGPVPAQEETGYSPVTNHDNSVVCALSAPDEGQRLRLAHSFCGLGRILSVLEELQAKVQNQAQAGCVPCGWCHPRSMNKVRGWGVRCPLSPSWLPLPPQMGALILGGGSFYKQLEVYMSF